MKKLILLILVGYLYLFAVNVAWSQASGMAFSSTLGTFTPITGGTVLGVATNDDTNFPALNLGFTFNYEGTDYTQVSVNTNGFLEFGSSVSSTYTALSSYNNVVAVLSFDIQGDATGEMMYITEGIAPDRVFTVQWLNYKAYGTTGVGDNFNFQIKLYENGAKIEVVYGSFVSNGTARAAQVGIRGGSATDINNRMVTALVNTWATSVAGIDNTSTCAVSTTSLPDNGLTFDWENLPQTFVSSTTAQVYGSVIQGALKQPVIDIQVVMTGALTPLTLTDLNLNINGTTLPADITNARVYYTGTSGVFSSTNQFGPTIPTPTGPFVVSGSQVLSSGTNHFWLAYDVSPTGIIDNYLDGECTSLTIDATPHVPDITAPDGSRQIKGALNGTYTVGDGGIYPNLGIAFADVGMLGLSGNVVFRVISDLNEPVPAYLAQWLESGLGNYTIQVVPYGGAWNVTGSFNDGVIVLNGADRVTIDGRLDGTGNNLTIMNTVASGASAAIRLISLGTNLGCNNVTIRNCNIYGADRMNTTCFGINVAGTGTVTSGTGANNNNLSILENNIKKCYYAIWVHGVSGVGQDTNLVISKNILGSDDPTEYVIYRGTDLAYCVSPNIKYNTIYNMMPGIGNTLTNISAIEIGTYCAGAVINGNTIHGIAQPSTGGWGAWGIDISSGTGNSNIMISNNAIWDLTTMNYSTTSTYYNPFGIRITGGTGTKVWSNSVHLYGTQPAVGTVGTLSAAFLVTSTAVTTLDVRDNVFVNGLEGMAGSNSYAVYSVAAAANYTYIDFNDYWWYGTYGVLGYIGGNKTNLSDWQTATGKDLMSKAEDPQFTDVSNLLPLMTSPLFLSGTPIPQVPYDILGNVRSTAAPTIGAYELTVAGQLPPPLLIAPANNAILVTLQPLFQWNSVDGATNYQIQVSLNSDFSTTVVDVTGLTATSYTPTITLLPITQYYWRVMATAPSMTGYWSFAWTFITSGPLAAPVLQSPADLSSNMIFPMTASWLPVFSATNYTIQVSTSSSFTSFIINQTGLTSANYLVAGLALGTQYYWRIQAYNTSYTSPWSTVWSFTTGYFATIGTGTSYNATTGFPCPYPRYESTSKQQYLITATELYANGALPGEFNSLSFNVYAMNLCNALTDYTISMKNTSVTSLTAWDMGDDFTDVYYSPSYLPYVGWNTHTFTSNFVWDGVSNVLVNICFNNTDANTENASCYYSTTTFTSTVYYYSYAANSTLCSAPAYTYTTTGRPNIIVGMQMGLLPPILPPSLIAPADNSLSVPVLPSFQWNTAVNAVTYYIQVSETSDFTTTVIDQSGIPSTSYTSTIALSPTTQYYWRVKGEAPGFDGIWSVRWKFITAGPLEAPVLLSPANESSDLIFPLLVTWNAVFAASNYHVQVSAVSDFSTLIVDQTGITTTNCLVSGLAMGTQFYWRVQAYNTSNTSPWSETWTFTTGFYVALGTGTLTNSSTSYPTPYGNFYTQSRHQFLFRADELLAAGAIPGEINSIGWNVLSTNDGDGMMNYTIKMKLTTVDVIAAFDQVDLVQVYTNSNYFPTTGWNTHYFDTPFEWDGASNILVETCFSDGTLNYSNNASVYYSTLTWNATVYDYDDETPTMCDPDAILYPNLSTNRPNTVFGLTPGGLPPLMPPILAAPANNAIGVPVIPVYQWNSVANAVTYNLQVSTVTDFSTTILDISGISATTYTPTISLDPTSQYYWRVKGEAPGYDGIWAAHWSFITGGPLPAPTLLIPANEAVGLPTPLTLTWEAVFGAQYYEVQIATDSGFMNILTDANNITTSQFLATGLLMSSQFYWRVNAYSVSNTSPWSEIWTFSTGTFATLGTGTTTNVDYEYPTPYGQFYTDCKHQFLFRATELLAAGATAGDFNSISWNVLSTNGMQAMEDYTIKIKATTANTVTGFDYGDDFQQVYTNAAFLPSTGWNTHMFESAFTWDGVSNILVDVCFSNGTDNYSYNASVYYSTLTWNASAYDYDDYTPLMCSLTSGLFPTTSLNRPNTMFSFSGSTPPPLPPVLISPANGATAVEVLPTFTWNPSDGAESYNIEISINSNFTTVVYDETTSTTQYQPPANLLNSTLYFWRVRGYNTGGSYGYWSTEWSFTTENLITVPWIVVENTGSLSNVIAPSTLNPTINGRAFASGDAIGIFYQRTPGNWQCAGYGLWTPTGASIIVWGDDPNTTIKDGFGIGEIYTVKVWDGQELIEYNANATYSVGPNNFQVNAFSIMGSLEVIIPTVQNFNLPVGWSMISSYINPFTTDLNTLFAGLTQNITIMKNGAGQNYIPANNINQIGNWNVINGYMIKLNAATQFQITGAQVQPQNTPIPLIATWNLIAYLRSTQMPAATALAGLGNTVVIAKNGLGQMYVPAYNINQIGNMVPGEGYYVDVNTAENLVYPANTTLKAIVGEVVSPMPTRLLPANIRTGSNASMILSINAADGNEIGIYNTANELIGSGVVKDGIAAITIWGDDATTSEIEGATNGENLTARLLDVTSDLYSDIALSDIREMISNNSLNGLSYTRDGLFHATGNTNTGIATELAVDNYPNPFSDVTTVSCSLPVSGSVSIELYNLQGELAGTVYSGFQSAGNHEFSYKSGNLPSGVYNLVLQLNGVKVSKMMMIVK